jgi:hypothetical protein
MNKTINLTIFNENEKNVIQVYLQKCVLNPQSPGFGDFLRGFITLYMYSKQYGYNAYIDASHPVFQYLTPNPYFITNPLTPIHEVISGRTSIYKNYNEIDKRLIELFETNTSFAVFTNGMYTKKDGKIQNFGKLTDDCKHILQSILTPTDHIVSRVQDVYNLLDIDLEKPYSIIHLRYGDDYLVDGAYYEHMFQLTYRKIESLLSRNPTTQFILLSDSIAMATKIKEYHPSLFYWNNAKIHTGGLQKDTGLEDTMIDFFILSKCDTIYYLHHSGFSRIISEVFDKPYIEL